MFRISRLSFISGILVLLSIAACSPKESAQSAADEKKATAIETDEQKFSYGLGHNIGSSLNQQAIPGVDVNILIEGIKDGLEQSELQVPREELDQALVRIREKQEAEFKATMVENLRLGEEYLVANGKREGVTTTDSGLQYEVLATGEGESPVKESKVKTHYHGTLVDGTVFDSSVDRGTPAEFGVNQVIPGWTEALQLMKTGDKWRVHVPANLAYGERSPGPDIPPNSVLIFDIELLEIL